MRRMFSLKQLEEISKKTIENANSLKIFENIVDKDGHPRFIEDLINLNTEIENVNVAYGRWSLSGSHLLMVLCLEISADVSFTKDQVLGTCNNMPSWIKEKIYPLKGIGVEWKVFTNINTDWSTAQTTVYLSNTSEGVNLCCDANITYEKANIVRMSFDLLIDND